MESTEQLTPGQWVLMKDDGFWSPVFYVAKIAEVKPKTVMVLEFRYREMETRPGRRDINKVIGVFPSESAALAAKPRIASALALRDQQKKDADLRCAATATALVHPVPA